MKSARIRSYLMLLVVSVIWGVASPIIKFTLDGFPAAVFLAYRFGISTILAIIIFAINGIHLPKDPKLILLIILYGFLNSVVSLGFLFFGMEDTTVIEAGLITMVEPLLISTAGVYFLHEHVTTREKIGMGIAIAGTALTIAGPLHFSGNLLVFGYVVSTLVTTLIIKKLLKKDVNPMTMTNISFIIGFICFAAFVLYKFGFQYTTYNILHTAPAYHLGVVYMAIISGTFAFWLFNKAQKSIEIGEASLFAYLYPVFSLPLAVAWLGEKIMPVHIVGGVIIIIGVVIAEIKKKRYNTISK